MPPLNNSNSTADAENDDSVADPIRSLSDFDLRLDGFRQLFDLNPPVAIDRLYELLHDPKILAERIAAFRWLLSVVCSSSNMRRHHIGEMRDYLRELWWLATGQLRHMAQSGEAEPWRLAVF